METIQSCITYKTKANKILNHISHHSINMHIFLHDITVAIVAIIMGENLMFQIYRFFTEIDYHRAQCRIHLC